MCLTIALCGLWDLVFVNNKYTFKVKLKAFLSDKAYIKGWIR